MNKTEIEDLCNKNNLNCKFTYKENEQENDICINQSKKAGSNITKEKEITITLSKQINASKPKDNKKEKTKDNKKNEYKKDNSILDMFGI